MLSIFSCTFKPSVCLLWRNIYLVPLPIFWLGCWIFLYWARWTACIFWRLLPCKSHNFQIFSPILSFWSRKWQPTLVFLPGEFHRWRSLVGCGSWGRKESDTTEWPPQHISCPFIFIISFSVSKLLSLIGSHLFTFVLFSLL